MERIRDFVIALRSGEYEQTTDTLAVKGEDGVTRHCCEGVAFQRYGEQLGYGLRWSALTDRMISVNPQRNSAEDIMTAPTDFWRDMGMSENDRQFRFVLPLNGDGEQLYCGDNDDYDSVLYAELNDAGFTFQQIADLIEWQFLSCRQPVAE